ncbi:FAD-dependent oxidoreductase [Rhodococcus globerulus]|uniref:FAD-dependent oxidoreductase n=1 Tax=Rhodococcus globerulus TaxID=33008 RepID=UPI001F199A90|nr:FAD-dependent oxidoreductase [Rhodococcus globerulus]MCE4267055.1 FAD-dependent oxidoreductase [Rhodococcus globerulus]
MQNETVECDVLVVGSGGGALTGAYTAAAQGLKTIVVEKTARFGGTSAYSGAAIWLAGTSVQERAGIGDSPEKARTYLRALLGDDELERQEAFVDTASRVVEFLEKDPNIEFEWRPFPDYYKRPGRMDSGRAINPIDLPSSEIGELRHLVRPEPGVDRAGGSQPEETLVGGRALIGRLLLALEATGHADLRSNTAAQKLIVDDGRVVGIEATAPDGAVIHIRAKHGVLLAAGGIEGSDEIRAAHSTPGRAQWSMGPRGANTGDLLTAAVALGADTDLLDEAWWCPGIELPDGRGAFLVGIRGGIVVDAHGDRYLNESLPYDQFGRAMIAQNKSIQAIPSYLVFDSREGEGVLPAISVPSVSAADHLAAETWVRADTIEALAAAINVPAANLTTTVERFNDFAKHGVDEDFARGEDPYDLFFCPPSNSGGSPNPALHGISQGPFYAARIVLSDLGTKGGLRTDADARVLRPDGSAIDGLYAAGNTAASLTGRHYPGPGIPLGTAMVFSYRAIEHMMK